MVARRPLCLCILVTPVDFLWQTKNTWERQTVGGKTGRFLCRILKLWKRPLPAHILTLNFMHAKCAWNNVPVHVAQQAELMQILATIQKHLIACFLHLSLTRTLKAVVIRWVLPPSLNEQVIISLSLGSPCPGGLSENLPPTCLQLCICFSLRFASLPFNLFSLSLLLWTLSLSPSSLQPLYFAPPISELWAALGFRWITHNAWSILVLIHWQNVYKIILGSCSAARKRRWSDKRSAVPCHSLKTEHGWTWLAVCPPAWPGRGLAQCLSFCQHCLVHHSRPWLVLLNFPDHQRRAAKPLRRLPDASSRSLSLLFCQEINLH